MTVMFSALPWIATRRKIETFWLSGILIICVLVLLAFSRKGYFIFSAAFTFCFATALILYENYPQYARRLVVSFMVLYSINMTRVVRDISARVMFKNEYKECEEKIKAIAQRFDENKYIFASTSLYMMIKPHHNAVCHTPHALHDTANVTYFALNYKGNFDETTYIEFKEYVSNDAFEVLLKDSLTFTPSSVMEKLFFRVQDSWKFIIYQRKNINR
jgi:hypothetical protein